jgi:hypothetical protein
LKISSNIKNFIKNASVVEKGDIVDPVKQMQRELALVSPISALTSQIRVGRVLMFRYKVNHNLSPAIDRVVLVASCKRGNGEGVIHAGTGNTLVSCFRLEATSAQVVSFITKELYNRRKVSSEIIRSLRSLIGQNSYRTYILSNMKNMHKIDTPNKPVGTNDG